VFIFSNLATSLDGKIATTNSREFFPLGTKLDRQVMQKLRAQCDVVLFGAETLRTFQKPCLALGTTKHPINAVISSRLEGISSKWPFFKSSKIKRILFVSPQCPARKIKEFSKTCQIVILMDHGSKSNVAPQIVDHLKSMKVRRLLVEGGGGVMWLFAQPNLIDEYYVTLTPRIVGGKNAPTLVDGVGFKSSEVLNLKLYRYQVVKDEIYLIYRKKNKRG